MGNDQCPVGARNSEGIENLKKQMAEVHPRIDREVQALNARLDTLIGRLPAWGVLMISGLSVTAGALLGALVTVLSIGK